MANYNLGKAIVEVELDTSKAAAELNAFRQQQGVTSMRMGVPATPTQAGGQAVPTGNVGSMRNGGEMAAVVAAVVATGAIDTQNANKIIEAVKGMNRDQFNVNKPIKGESDLPGWGGRMLGTEEEIKQFKLNYVKQNQADKEWAQSVVGWEKHKSFIGPPTEEEINADKFWRLRKRPLYGGYGDVSNSPFFTAKQWSQRIYGGNSTFGVGQIEGGVEGAKGWHDPRKNDYPYNNPFLPTGAPSVENAGKAIFGFTRALGTGIATVIAFAYSMRKLEEHFFDLPRQIKFESAQFAQTLNYDIRSSASEKIASKYTEMKKITENPANWSLMTPYSNEQKDSLKKLGMSDQDIYDLNNGVLARNKVKDKVNSTLLAAQQEPLGRKTANEFMGTMQPSMFTNEYRKIQANMYRESQNIVLDNLEKRGAPKHALDMVRRGVEAGAELMSRPDTRAGTVTTGQNFWEMMQQAILQPQVNYSKETAENTKIIADWIRQNPNYPNVAPVPVPVSPHP
jgi:hypothetical protein